MAMLLVIEVRDVGVAQAALCMAEGLPGIDGSLSSVNLREATDVQSPSCASFDFCAVAGGDEFLRHWHIFFQAGFLDGEGKHSAGQIAMGRKAAGLRASTPL